MHPVNEYLGNLVDWSTIECVFLDMDGTLLDLNYDNYVWGTLVPQAYADLKNLSLHTAQQTLLPYMHKIRGTLEFYCFDHWINYTGIDLVAVHDAASALLSYRPGAEAFLNWLRQIAITSVIATNAHPESIRVKHNSTRICDLVDAVVSNQQYSAPKETDQYWIKLLQDFPYPPSQCLFIDDNIPVLESAERNGIGHLLTISRPDSQRPKRSGLGYPAFDDFSEIYPAKDRVANNARL